MIHLSEAIVGIKNPPIKRRKNLNELEVGDMMYFINARGEKINTEITSVKKDSIMFRGTPPDHIPIFFNIANLKNRKILDGGMDMPYVVYESYIKTFFCYATNEEDQDKMYNKYWSKK